MKFIKNNYVLLIVCFIFLLSGTISALNYKKEIINARKTWVMHYKTSCSNGNVSDCDVKVVNMDTIATYGYIVNIYDCHMYYIAPLLIITIASYYLHKYIRKGYLKQAINRKEYNALIKDIYIKVLKCSLILPLYMLFLFIVSYILSGHFDYNVGKDVYRYIGFNNIELSIHWVKFIILYIINFFINSIFWINIAMLNIKHNKSLVVSIIVSYIELILMYMIFESVALLLPNIESIMLCFLLKPIWDPHDISYLGLISVSSMFAILTMFMIRFKYKNKEDLLEEISK